MQLEESLVKKVHQEIAAIMPEIIEFRHQLHQNPELGRKEFKTKERILAALSQLRKEAGLEISSPILETDVVANLSVNSEITIGLRADMDALPIKEKNNLPYASENGYMHACGHDGHTASLLGAARVLCRLKKELTRNVRFIFQPGEELLCAGKDMVEAGVCNGLQNVYALHAWPGLPLGQIACKPGVLFSCGGHFNITVKGKGSHGAQPHLGINPITTAAEIINELENLHYRFQHEDDSLLSVCMTQAGFCSNVIPDNAVISGTFRCSSHERIKELKELIRCCCENIALKRKCSLDTSFATKYDLPLINSDYSFKQVRDMATRYLPQELWYEVEKETRGMEDFAFYTNACANGAMFWLGTGKDCAPLHNACFNFPDAALENGILLLCLLALSSS